MDEHKPAAMLSTQDLLAACQEQTNAAFTVNQLGDWVAAGLLPPSAPGRGRGRRVGGTDPRQWTAECLPRLIVIAQSRRGTNVRIDRAAYALASAGFSPGAQHLRALLVALNYELNAGVQDALKTNRRFLDRRDLSPEEQRKRFHRSEQRRHAGEDPAVRTTAEQMKLVLLGISDPQSNRAITDPLEAFSYERVRATLTSATDEAILGAYTFVGQQLPVVMPLVFAAYAAIRASGDALLDAYEGMNRDAVARAIGLFSEILQAGPDDFSTRYVHP